MLKASKAECPHCGEPTEQTYTCPGCDAVGCVERCNTGGNNCLCNECEEQEAEED
jgi:hypothetical protein